MSGPDESMVERVARAVCGKHCDMPKCSCQPNANSRAACQRLSMDEARAAIEIVADQCAKYCEAQSGAYPAYSEARAACRRLGRVIRALAHPPSPTDSN